MPPHSMILDRPDVTLDDGTILPALIYESDLLYTSPLRVKLLEFNYQYNYPMGCFQLNYPYLRHYSNVIKEAVSNGNYYFMVQNGGISRRINIRWAEIEVEPAYEAEMREGQYLEELGQKMDLAVVHVLNVINSNNQLIARVY